MAKGTKKAGAEETHAPASSESEAPAMESPALPELPTAPTEPAPAAPKATQRGYVICKVVGTDVYANNRLIPEGSIDEFTISDVASIPHVLVPIEE